MGETIKSASNELVERWKLKMPRLFYYISVAAMCILCVAVTIHFTVESAGAQHVEWWSAIYPYIVGGCAGIITVCKLTVNGGYKKLDLDKIPGRTILDKDDN
jgi:hypothetical protein